MRRGALLGACLALSCAAFLPEPSTPSARPERLLGSAHTSFARGDLGLALDLSRQAEMEAVGFDDRETEITAILARAGMYRWMAWDDSARAAAARGVSRAREAGLPCLEVEGSLVLMAIDLGDSRGRTHSPQALERQCTNRLFRTRLRFMQAREALANGDDGSAKRFLGRPRGIPKAARAEITQEHRFLTAWLRSLRGRHQDALSLADRVLAKDRAEGVKPAIVDDLLLLARLHRAAGNDVRALDCTDRAIKVIESMRPQSLVARRLERTRELLR